VFSGKYHLPRDTRYETDDIYPRKPDASLYNPSPAYLRSLLETEGITQEEAATALGITDRIMRYYLSNQESATYRPAPYVIQCALEQLAAYAIKKRRVKRD
jgi:hypothetical protein